MSHKKGRDTTFISSPSPSSPRGSRLLDIGLSRIASNVTSPGLEPHPSTVVSPSRVGPSYTASPGSWMPLENLYPATAVGSASYITLIIFYLQFSLNVFGMGAFSSFKILGTPLFIII